MPNDSEDLNKLPEELISKLEEYARLKIQIRQGREAVKSAQDQVDLKVAALKEIEKKFLDISTHVQKTYLK